MKDFSLFLPSRYLFSRLLLEYFLILIPHFVLLRRPHAVPLHNNILHHVLIFFVLFYRDEHICFPWAEDSIGTLIERISEKFTVFLLCFEVDYDRFFILFNLAGLPVTQFGLGLVCIDFAAEFLQLFSYLSLFSFSLFFLAFDYWYGRSLFKLSLAFFDYGRFCTLFLSLGFFSQPRFLFFPETLFLRRNDLFLLFFHLSLKRFTKLFS